jgi:hypothetical protein
LFDQGAVWASGKEAVLLGQNWGRVGFQADVTLDFGAGLRQADRATTIHRSGSAFMPGQMFCFHCFMFFDSR